MAALDSRSSGSRVSRNIIRRTSRPELRSHETEAVMTPTPERHHRPVLARLS